jgi:hypothetical protein
VYVECTNNGVENCGLMQAYAGSVSFDPSDPQGSITQMVVDGTQGTSEGPGLVQVSSPIYFNSHPLYLSRYGNWVRDGAEFGRNPVVQRPRLRE